jgi:hypothetical protein
MSIKKLFDGMTFKEKVVYSYILILFIIFGLLFLEESSLIIDIVVIISPFIFSSILILNFDNFIKNKIEKYFYIYQFTIHIFFGLFVSAHTKNGFNLDDKLIPYIIIACIINYCFFIYLIKNKVKFNSKFILYLSTLLLYSLNVITTIDYINREFDYSLKNEHTVYITQKSIEITKRRTKLRNKVTLEDHYFEINRINELENLNKVKVSEELYSKKNVLDTLKIELHQGFLKSKWYRVNE